MLYDSRQYQQRLEQEARREQEQREMAKEKYELNAAVQRENEKARERGEDGPGVGTARNGNKRAVEKGRNRGGLAEEERTGELELRTIHRFFCGEMISSKFSTNAVLIVVSRKAVSSHRGCCRTVNPSLQKLSCRRDDKVIPTTGEFFNNDP